MTAAETMYGRRGGGWAPKPPTATATGQPEPKARPDCRVCGRTADEHTGRLCPACMLPIEHHTPSPRDLEHTRRVVTEAECWAARSRMAQAKHHAGGTLNDVELAAVRCFPDPVTLTANGYTAVPFSYSTEAAS